MGLFDILKSNKKAADIQWTLRVAEDEMPVEPETFEINLDSFLQDLEMGDIEFIVLAPSEVVNGITFLQVASSGYGYMHVEAGLNENIKMISVLENVWICSLHFISRAELIFPDGKT